MAGAKAAAFSSVAIAMAFAGRSARACDVCASKSAQWFCAADDAFLCAACDTQVHSANAVSRRHERVRLSPNGTPLKATSSGKKSEQYGRGSGEATCKKVHGGPAQVAPVCKRSRTTRPYSHHLKKLTQVVKSELSEHQAPSVAVKAELEIRDFLDADEFFVPDAGNQEVPNLAAVIAHDSSSDEFGLSLPSDHEFQEGDHTASADSFAVYFKGKAAHSQKVVDDGDQFLVPDAGLGDEFCNVECDSSSPDSMGASGAPPGDAFFFPGDIPGLDVGFESFVPDMDLSSDDFSLSFDLALQNSANKGVETFEGDGCKPKVEQAQAAHEFATGPFAKWFATKRKSEPEDVPRCAQTIRREAQAMLKCCQDGDDDAPKVPALQLNMHDVLVAWSDRGEPWVDYELLSDRSLSSDAGLVPDLDAAVAGDEQGQNGGDRDARVLRYKEKRRTRLFSKKIRYEVRKLNAERRPRMKGRFVKRTAAAS